MVNIVFRKNIQTQKAFMLLGVLIFTSISIIIVLAFVMWTTTSVNIARRTLQREQALQIAEAGIDYYRWHLAKNSTDYKDGTGVAGPYVHAFYDSDGNQIGQYSLLITPPPAGSTLVKIFSTGTLTGVSNVSRTIESDLAIPSFAKFSVVANDNMRFGEGTEIFGPLHSNFGIRMDGIAHNLITSALTSYDDPDHSGGSEFAVHTHDTDTSSGTNINDTYRSAEAPPNTVTDRSDVFMAGRKFPVPVVDFAGITTDLSKLKTLGSSTDGKYYAASGKQGYHIVLKTNDTYDIYTVTALTATPNGCTNVNNETDWSTWSIKTETLTAGNVAFPVNGVIFVEDNVWVDGSINTARKTIAAGRFPDDPTKRKNIIVNNDLRYINVDGQDVIGLVAQNNVNVGLSSLDNLRIDGALIAQNGRVGRSYYGSSCGTGYTRNSLRLYGMIGSNQRYGFAYTDGTGYDTRIITYDANLLYGAPPSFPLTSDQYQTILWEER
ncbi:MAG: type IV pilus modification PilV family protein [Minisyncoccia bacterium]